MKPKGFAVGSRIRLYGWSGQWVVWDRSATSWLNNDQCECHKFCLFVGPFGVEVDLSEAEEQALNEKWENWEPGDD